MKYLLSILFIGAGVMHFVKTEFYLKIIPPDFPMPGALIYLSGFAAIICGAGLLLKRTQKLAAWGLVAFLIAVLPVNVHMALHPEMFPNIPAWALWGRLPLQFVMMLWAHRYVR